MPSSNCPGRDRRGQFRLGVKARDALAAAAGIGLDDDRIAQSFRRGDRLVGRVDDARRQKAQTQRFQQRSLGRLGYFIAKCLGAVDDAHALQLQMLEIGQGMEDSGAMLAAVRRRAHAIEQHFEARLLRAHFIKMIGYENFLEGTLRRSNSANICREPLRVFVQKCQRRAICPARLGYGHCTARYRHEPLLHTLKKHRPNRK